MGFISAEIKQCLSRLRECSIVNIEQFTIIVKPKYAIKNLKQDKTENLITAAKEINITCYLIFLKRNKIGWMETKECT